PQYKFPEKTAPGATRPQTIRPQAAPDFSSITPVALQDWRFSHSSPALLISVNIASLLRSPVWNNLLPANARSALSEIGQVLISIEANSTTSPSVLMLARGSIDDPMGMWLRSSADTDAKRLDAMTLLIGDPRSLQFADLRLRG